MPPVLHPRKKASKHHHFSIIPAFQSSTVLPPVQSCTFDHAGRRGAVATAREFGSRGLGYGSRLPRCGAMSLGKALPLYVHSLDASVNGYLLGQILLVCSNISSAVMAAGAVCTPGRWAATGTNRSNNQGQNVKATIIEPLGAKFTPFKIQGVSPRNTRD